VQIDVVLIERDFPAQLVDAREIGEERCELGQSFEDDPPRALIAGR
jgi:hypothetical protein